MLKIYAAPTNKGYIAGANDGIVTVLGVPSRRRVWLLNPETLAVEQTVLSLANGHYMFVGLDVLKEYLVMVRDHKKEFEPFAWDYVRPADDLTASEKLALWNTWQT